MQLNSRVAVLQNKLELLGSNSDSELMETYKQQNEQLQAELDEVRTELKHVGICNFLQIERFLYVCYVVHNVR